MQIKITRTTEENGPGESPLTTGRWCSRPALPLALVFLSEKITGESWSCDFHFKKGREIPVS